MDLSTVSDKHINELEQQASALLKTLRAAKLQEHPAYAVLQALEQEVGQARRDRFDQQNPEYRGF